MKVNIRLSADEQGQHPKSEMSETLQEDYTDFADPVESYRVQFKMVNVSGFNLRKPALTFRLPIQRQHPQKPPLPQDPRERPLFAKTKARSFNSNLYNSQRELRVLEFADTRILSNSNLPYWNDQEEITIWIRMALNDIRLKPFIVDVSINCENADGLTKKVAVAPRKLLGVNAETI